jgi:hypothetical protein
MWYETGAMFFISGFPHHQDFIYRDVTDFVVTVFQMKHSVFHLQDLTSQARGASTVDIYFLAQ